MEEEIKEEKKVQKLDLNELKKEEEKIKANELVDKIMQKILQIK